MGNIDLRTFSELFSENNLFRIPNYQRGFAWQLTHINDFWYDLVNLHPEKTHYTGMITIQKLKSKKDYAKWEDDLWFLEKPKHNPYHVIDGQQRITTFVLLINSMVHYAIKHGIDKIDSYDIEDIKSKYICRREKGLSSYVFGYEVDNPSFRFLKYRIIDNNPLEHVDESYYTNNLETAKKYFDDQLEDYCKDNQNRLDELFNKLTTKMQFVEYDIKPSINVFVTFETMNNRGKKLSNLELLKNRLIYLVTLFNDETANKHRKDQITRKINEKMSIVYKWLGNRKDKPLDDNEFLRNHWIMYFGYSRNTGGEYVNFLLNKYFTTTSVLDNTIPRELIEERNDIDYEMDNDEECSGEMGDDESDYNNELENRHKIEPIDIETYVDNLAFVSEKWFYSYHPDNDNTLSHEEQTAISRLNHLGVAYFRPLIVASLINKEITKEKRIQLFESIERAILLIFRMARSMSTYQSSVYYRLSHQLINSKISVDVVLYHLNKMFVDNIVSGMKTFKAKMDAAYENEEGFFHWNSLKFILYEYEVSICPKGEEMCLTWEQFTAPYKDKVSIEHIYPQTVTEGQWPEFDDCDKNAKKYLTNSLGNLLLLRQPKNSALQNNPFCEKKKGTDKYVGYEQGSESEREVSANNKWGPEEIRDRGMKILEFITKRWHITYKNRDQMYGILGIPDRYREKIDEPDPATKKAQLIEELLGGFDFEPADLDKEDVPIDKIMDYSKSRNRLVISGIVYDNQLHKSTCIHDAVISVLKDIIDSDPSKMDKYCDVKEKRQKLPLFTKQEYNSPCYVSFGDLKIYLDRGKTDLVTLGKVVFIYGLDPESVLVRVRKR